MSTPKQKKNGEWWSREYVGYANGVRKYKVFSAPTRAELKQVIAEYRVTHRPISSYGSLTLREAMRVYIESKSEVLSPSTLIGYENIIKNHLKGLMNKRAATLTQLEMQKEINEEASRFSPKTVGNVIGLLSATLHMVGAPVPVLSKPKPIVPDIVIPTEEELKVLISNSKDMLCEMPILLASFMGLRLSEICAIDLRRDYNPETKMLYVHEAMVRGRDNKYHIKTTKSKNSTRYLKVPKTIIPKIEEARENVYVFSCTNTVKSSWRRLKIRCGLERIRFHDLRHYFASTLYELNIPKFYAIALMGHNSDKMLDKVYAHLKGGVSQSIADKISEYYSQNISWV